MDDLISRQAAIDALIKRDKELRNINWYDKPFAEGECKGIDYALEIVNALPSVQPTQSNASNALKTLDCIDRQAAIDAINTWDKFGVDERCRIVRWHEGLEPYVHLRDVLTAIVNLPAAQPDRDIPIKPTETTDKAWGIPHRQAVCPRCDYYLGHVAFLGDYKGKRITYCETCGQAIDWSEWEDEDEQI